MKIFFNVLLSVCLLALLVMANTDEEKKKQAEEMVRGMAQECKDKVKASDGNYLIIKLIKLFFFSEHILNQF